ncbi:MAG: SCP2 sterol-binding domain-containing protein [Anaerolineales bacterium]
MADDVTIGVVMERMPAVFLPEKAKDIDSLIHYHFTGEGGGDWTMTIAGGTCQVSPGSAGEPKLTITATATDYIDIALGKVDPISAFAAGKVKLQGDLALAMKLTGFFRRS